MLVMLCTRCQQREARPWPAEARARIEAEWGVAVPNWDRFCEECWREWIRTPEAQKEMEPVMRAMTAKFERDMDRWKENARGAALKVLDVADAIAGKF